jgi:hypothetical protein
LESAAIRLVADAAHALASAKAVLDTRFPRQREYVAAFFLDVANPRSDRNDPATPGALG